MEQTNPCKSFLHGKTVEDVGRMVKVITVKENQCVEDAIRVFSEHDILSAPVVNDKGEMVGMVDMLDVAHFVLNVCPPEEQIKADHLASLTIAGRAMAFKKIKEIMESSGRDALAPLNQHSPATMAVELFASGVHRCPVVDDTENLIGFMSQSSLLSVLNEQMPRANLKLMGAKTLAELGLGLSEVISAKLTDSVIDVIRKLDQNSVSAVALTDEKGKVVSNFSITDMRGLWSEVWPSFVLPVGEYLENIHPESLGLMSVSVDRTTLSEAMSLMLKLNVHRLWTTRLEKGVEVPCGVVSMTDLMSLFQNYEMAT